MVNCRKSNRLIKYAELESITNMLLATPDRLVPNKVLQRLVSQPLSEVMDIIMEQVNQEYKIITRDCTVGGYIAHTLFKDPDTEPITRVALDDIVFDEATFKVERNGQETQLTATEGLLLRYLIENAGEFVSAKDLALQLTGRDVSTGFARVYIKYLRDKGVSIDNVWGKGYRVGTAELEGITIGEATYYPKAHAVEHDGTTSNLTPTEEKLLNYLLDNKGEFVSAKDLALQLTGRDDVSTGFAHNYVVYLRRKGVSIDNVGGKGYRVGEPKPEQGIEIGGAMYYPNERTVERDGETTILTERQHDVLMDLLKKPEGSVTSLRASTKTYICSLRKVLGEDTIKTMSGRGSVRGYAVYTIVPEPVSEQLAA